MKGNNSGTNLGKMMCNNTMLDHVNINAHTAGRVAQLVTSLATDASLTAEPGPVLYFVEIDHEILSTVILLPSTESFKKGFCQIQAKVCARSTG